jgi:uncharacterized membrane protein YdjX (TVP38/TMEM64 family)
MSAGISGHPRMEGSLMKGSTWIKLGLLLFVIVGAGWILRAMGVRFDQLTPERVRTYVLSFGAWAPLIYLIGYAQPIVPLPASIMTATGGLAFGPAWGLVAAMGGATARACAQFLVARLLGREAVAKLLRGQAATLDERIGQNAFKTVLLIRLIPNFPFDMQNYALGFSQVRFAPYAVATLLGIIPGSFAYVYLGYSLTDLKQLWKLGVAIVIIIGLMVAQRVWTARRRQPSSDIPLRKVSQSRQ